MDIDRRSSSKNNARFETSVSSAPNERADTGRCCSLYLTFDDGTSLLFTPGGCFRCAGQTSGVADFLCHQPLYRKPSMATRQMI